MMRAVLVMLLSLVLMCSCTDAAQESDDGLVIVASSFPCYDAARAVLGGTKGLTMLLPPGTDTHSFEPTIDDVVGIQECDLFIYVGGESDGWLDSLLSSLDEDVTTFALVDNVPMLLEEETEGILEEEYGLQDIRREDIHVNVLGINHFTWFDYASYMGMDLFPVYREYVDKHFEEGFHERDMNWANSCFACAHRVKFDLFRRFGLIAAAGDRHLAEFMPGDEYLNDPETVKKWKFGLTTVAWRKEDLKDRLEKSRRLLSGGESVELKPTGEEGILLIKALCGLTRMVSNVNIPNSALQIANLPADAVVETNAVFERDAVRPLYAGKLPEDVRGLIMPHVENHGTILQAALSCDKEAVVQAFLNDPLVKGKKCGENDVRQLVDDMLRATQKYLPEGWKGQI